MRSQRPEIDIVILRSLVLAEGIGKGLYDEIRAFREASGDARLKTILGTGNLVSLSNVARASLVAMMAGADFIKDVNRKRKCKCQSARQFGDAPAAFGIFISTPGPWWALSRQEVFALRVMRSLIWC